MIVRLTALISIHLCLIKNRMIRPTTIRHYLRLRLLYYDRWIKRCRWHNIWLNYWNHLRIINNACPLLRIKFAIRLNLITQIMKRVCTVFDCSQNVIFIGNGIINLNRTRSYLSNSLNPPQNFVNTH